MNFLKMFFVHTIAIVGAIVMGFSVIVFKGVLGLAWIGEQMINYAMDKQ